MSTSLNIRDIQIKTTVRDFLTWLTMALVQKLTNNKCWRKCEEKGTSHTVSEKVKITTDGDCSREIKRGLLLGRKAMTNLDSIFKRRDITLPTKVHLVKAMVFPVVMYGGESWVVKKAEH